MNKISKVSLQERTDALWAVMIKYAQSGYPVQEFTIEMICEQQRISKPMAWRVFKNLVRQYKVYATKRVYRSNVGMWHFWIDGYNPGYNLTWVHEKALANVRQVASNKFYNSFMGGLE